ncbi:Hypothetical predicted protein [Octopus vulgaris]|uniref:Uncharacterized protein n=1 Tax=Octopus vulgaris TaxID=6645 RepID=A0AA36AWP5_OCTVU|nr:Hypothetical predicted protein [Octopus vulgaris]
MKEVVKNEGDGVVDEGKLAENIIKVRDAMPSDLKDHFGIGMKKVASLRRKYKHIASGKQLTPSNRSIIRYNHDQMEAALEFCRMLLYNLKLCTFVHTGVQDGKANIDAHFATAMRHVYMHCNMGSDVITPVELVDSLNANGGVSNTVAELVVYGNSNLPLTATCNLINGTTNDVNEGNCESESDEKDCASNENEIFDTDTVKDIGVVEKGRGSLTKCIVYSVEGNIAEKHRIRLTVASNINDFDMESDEKPFSISFMP